LRVEGLGAQRAERACERAFAEVAEVHRLMSFHEHGSDLDRLHCARPGTCVRVDARTREVLDCALHIAAASAGRFDPSVAAQQVAWGLLPRPPSTWTPDPRVTWRDIELVGARGVRLARPLWIDLGGIAKGYAVDRAVAVLLDAGATQVCVNAGGDLRIAGDRAEPVHLRSPREPQQPHPALELANGAVASSCGFDSRRRIGRLCCGPHVHGTTRAPVSTSSFVSIVAPTCIVADALTKVVLAGDDGLSRRVLAQFGARACVQTAGSNRRLIGVAA
jgi:thiamine biosynthesis lipoprotein